MANIAIPVTVQPNTLAKSSDINSNFAEVQTKYNLAAVQTDVAKTITVAHTFSASQILNGGLSIGTGGTPLLKATVYAPILTAASVAANTVAEQTFTVTGLAQFDKVIVNLSGSTGNATALVGARVPSANTLVLAFLNPTGGALTPLGPNTYFVLAFGS